jgi:hypothetical protein
MQGFYWEAVTREKYIIDIVPFGFDVDHRDS